jgi:hypothetical protein
MPYFSETNAHRDSAIIRNGHRLFSWNNPGGQLADDDRAMTAG